MHSDNKAIIDIAGPSLCPAEYHVVWVGILNDIPLMLVRFFWLRLGRLDTTPTQGFVRRLLSLLCLGTSHDDNVGEY